MKAEQGLVIDATFDTGRSAIARLYATRTYANAGNPDLLARVRAEDRLVLDVGCGSGENAELLVRRGACVHGVTASPEERDRAARVMARVALADVETWECDYADGFFDAMICSHVLEHLVDPSTTLRTLGRVVRTGGRVYIALPNVAFWRQRLRMLQGRFEYEDAGLMDRTHLRFFTFFTARQLLAAAGLREVEASVTGGAPIGRLRTVLPAPGRALDAWCCARWPNVFGYQIILVGEKC